MQLGYRPRLDGVRGVAIALVVLSHSITPLGKLGQVGVGLFFVLSAFLITTLLEEERAATGRVALGRFFARRALRLVPAVALLLVVYVALSVFGVIPVSRVAALRGALITASYSGDLLQLIHREHLIPVGLSHTWSLAVEEQFYLVWPTALGLSRARFGPTSRWLKLVLVCAGVAALTRWTVWTFVGGRDGSLLFTPIAWIDAFLVGGWLAVKRRSSEAGWPKVHERWMLLAWLPALVLLVEKPGSHLFGSLDYLVGFSALAVGNGFLVTLAARDHSGGGWLASRPLVYLGRLSYGLYLWHYVLIRFCGELFPGLPKVLQVSFAVALSVAAAAASNRFVERPFLRLKDRRFAHETRPDAHYETR